MFDFDVDLVYLWCDGSDPEFARRRAEALQITDVKLLIGNGSNRCENHDELKFSLRSVELYLPWIRKIHIVMDQNPPEWLNVSNPKMHIVKAEEVYTSDMPRHTFNSCAIETVIHRIPDLAEHFIYGNDDCYVSRCLQKSFFFSEDGKAIQYVYRWNIMKSHFNDTAYLGKQLQNSSKYNRTLIKVQMLLFKEFKKELCWHPSHNFDAFNRSVLEEQIENSPLTPLVKETRKHILRQDDDLQRCAYSWRAAMRQKQIIKVMKNSVFRYRVKLASIFVLIDKLCFNLLQKYLSSSILFTSQVMIFNHESFYPIKADWSSLFCLNDGENATADYHMECRNYLLRRFPNKSQYEK